MVLPRAGQRANSMAEMLVQNLAGKSEEQMGNSLEMKKAESWDRKMVDCWEQMLVVELADLMAVCWDYSRVKMRGPMKVLMTAYLRAAMTVEY